MAQPIGALFTYWGQYNGFWQAQGHKHPVLHPQHHIQFHIYKFSQAFRSNSISLKK